MNDILHHTLLLLGGMSLFLFGTQHASNALERIFAAKISKIMNRISKSPLTAITMGTLLTAILQSSGAVTSMLVSLGSAKVITLTQVMGVIIGTAIGSTLTVQLISFKLNEYGLIIFSLAFLFYFTSKNRRLQNLLQVFVGLGLLFFGLDLMGIGASFLANLPELKPLFNNLQSHPFYSLLVSMVLCALIHSSAVTIGLAMTLAHVGAISTYDALFWVYGANIGTTSTALLAAYNSNHIGKQVAWAHFFYKSLSVVLFYPFSSFFISLVQFFDPTPFRFIANSHLIFNLLSAALFYPFINWGARFVENLFPKNTSEEFGLEFLKLNHYKSTSLAISFSLRELMRVSDIVYSMIENSLDLFKNFSTQKVEDIHEKDNQVDFLYREIKMFLLAHANKNSSQVNEEIMDMILFLSDLERAADAIDINLVGLASKKSALKLEFSGEGQKELSDIHNQVLKCARLAMSAFHNKELCPESIELKRELAATELKLRENHIARLNQGVLDSINTSSIHLDVLSEYRRIVSLLTSHAYKSRSKRPKALINKKGQKVE